MWSDFAYNVPQKQNAVRFSVVAVEADFFVRFANKDKDKEIRMKRLLVAAGSVGWLGVLFAETCTWTGGSGKWSEASCWADARVPTAGDAVVLNASEAVTIVNDCGPLSLESIEFQGAGLTLSSEDVLTLTGKEGVVLWNRATADVTIEAPLSFSGGLTNVVSLGGASKALVFGGPISGAGAVWFSGNASKDNLVKLLANNTYEGGTRYSYCSVVAGTTSAFGAARTCVWHSAGDGSLTLNVPGDWNYSFMIGSSGSQQLWFQTAGTYNVNGKVLASADSGWFRPYTGSGVVVNFNEAVELPGYTMYQHPHSNAELHFKKPLHVDLIRNGSAFGYAGGYICLDAPTNDYREVWVGFSDNIKCGVPFALAPSVPILWKEYLGGKGYLDLCGHDQTALALDTGDGTATTGRYVASTGSGATLFLCGATKDYAACCILKDAVSLVWNPAEAVVQELKDHSHPTSGALMVSNGTLRISGASTLKNLSAVRVADGATFDLATTQPSSLESLQELVIGEGGRFVAVDSAATPFGMDRLVLELSETATLELPAGCDCSFAAIYVTEGGVRRAVSGGDQTGKIKQIVGGGRIAVKMTEVAEDPATWTAGGGSDTRIGTAANWNDGQAHDLASGGFLPTFAAAGLEARVDAPAAFKGIVFSGAGESFALTGVGPVSLHGRGIVAEAPHGAVRTNVVDVPLSVRADQTWKVASGTTLRVAAPLSSDFAYAVTNAGSGTVELAASSPSFVGTFVHAGGTLDVLASTNAFGGAGDAPVVIDEVKAGSGVRTRLYGTVVERPVVYYAWNNSNVLMAHDRTTNRFTRAFTLPQTGQPFRPRLKNRSVVICEDGMSAANYFTPTGDDWGLCYWIFENGPFTCERSFNVGQYLCATFNAVGNSIQNYLSLEGPQSSLAFGVDFAFDQPKLPLSIGANAKNGAIRLNGHSQRFGDFRIAAGASGLAVDSSAPAVLYVNQTTDTTNAAVDFTGFAGLSKAGAATLTLDLALSSTGTVEVTEGTLALTANGSWAFCTNVTVSGSGTYSVAAARAFSRKASVSISDDGKVEIAAGVTLVCKGLYLGGSDVEMPAGTYSRTAAPEAYRKYFAGDGVLVSRGTRPGMVFVVR